MPNRVLFVTYGGGHAQMVTPVAQAIGARADCRILALPSAIAHVQASGLPMMTFKDLLDPAIDKDALKWGHELAEVHHSDHSGIEYADSAAYLGLSFADLVDKHGLQDARQRVADKGRHAFHPTSVLARAMDQVRPDMVVATSSPRAEAAALEVARARGIASLALIDLFSGVTGYTIPATDATFLTDLAARICVDLGVLDLGRTRVHVLGNPAFDRLLNYRFDPKDGWIRTQLPWLADDRPLVLHADMPAWLDSESGMTHTKSKAEIWAEMELVYKACQEIGANYAVRPHPSQPPELFNQFVSKRDHAGVAAKPPLHPLLMCADAVVARSTTVALEAVYLKRRVVQLEPQRHGDLPLVQMGVAVGAKHLSELAPILRSCLQDDQANRVRLDRIEQTLPQRPAAEAIAELILSKLSQQPDENEKPA